ncbi:MAG TPA: hypothetical protein VG938_11415, partial [Verrucomicrobiae bacterium]|nr:hypothetical protein [Verrucomicrobiae bacterium]
MIAPNPITPTDSSGTLIPYINLKLALLGFQPPGGGPGGEFSEIASSLVAQYREKERLLATHVCPPDQRIQSFLY